MRLIRIEMSGSYAAILLARKNIEVPAHHLKGCDSVYWTWWVAIGQYHGRVLVNNSSYIPGTHTFKEGR